jgi:hypothetical protein
MSLPNLFRSLWLNVLVVYEVAVPFRLVRTVCKKYVFWFGSVRKIPGSALVPDQGAFLPRVI